MKILDLHPTPNPSAVKFIVDRPLTTPSESTSADSEGGTTHPLLRKILQNDRVQSAFIHGSWITIRFDADNAREDRELMRSVADVIRDFDGDTELSDEDQNSEFESEDPKLMLIRDTIESEVLPYLHSHGGSLEVVGLEDNLVFIRYMGACGGCPASTTATLKGIETLLKKEVDPDIEVQLV